jgi:predicted metal-dependent peptidase
VDTSGSMSEDDLSLAWSEVRGVLRSVGVRRDCLTVFAGDVVARKVSDWNATTELVGGGGTDMSAIMQSDAVAAARPDVVVVVTDGGTAWPERPVARRTIAVIVENGTGWPVPDGAVTDVVTLLRSELVHR